MGGRENDLSILGVEEMGRCYNLYTNQRTIFRVLPKKEKRPYEVKLSNTGKVRGLLPCAVECVDMPAAFSIEEIVTENKQSMSMNGEVQLTATVMKACGMAFGASFANSSTEGHQSRYYLWLSPVYELRLDGALLKGGELENPFIDDEVARELTNLQPNKNSMMHLIERYGTHFLSSVMVGGAILVHVKRRVSDGKQNANIEAEAKLNQKLEKAGKAQGAFKALYESIQYDSEAEITFRMYGGDIPSSVNMSTCRIAALTEENAASIAGWIESISKNPACLMMTAKFTSLAVLSPLRALHAGVTTADFPAPTKNSKNNDVSVERNTEIHAELSRALDNYVATGDPFPSMCCLV